MVHLVIPLLFKKVKTSAFLADGVGENKTASMFVYMTILHPFFSVNYFPGKTCVGQLWGKLLCKSWKDFVYKTKYSYTGIKTPLPSPPQKKTNDEERGTFWTQHLLAV